jgi:uncharacterized membrane protein
MNKFLKEFVLWILIILPIVYLATIWHKLPEIVPTHFNNDGIANGWSHKSTLIILTVALGVGFYFLMLAIPFLDPKKNIKKMGNKYYNFRFLLTFFIALLTTYLLTYTNRGNFKNPNLFFVFIGAFLAILGNFMKTIRPNHFIGIRTPWTLESDHTWEKTHQLGGPIWVVGGIMIAILPFVSPLKDVMTIIFLGIVAIMALVPIVYSYIVYKNEEEEE